MLGAAVTIEVIPAENEDMPIHILFIVTAIGGLVTLVILALLCTECIARIRGRLTSQTEEEEPIQQMPIRRNLKTASIPIAQPRRTAEPEVESPARPFADVLRGRYNIHRRTGQTTAGGIDPAEDIFDVAPWERTALAHRNEQQRGLDPSSAEFDRYSIFTNSQVAASDAENTYVQRMNAVGAQLAQEDNDDSPSFTQPLRFSRYKPTPPPSYSKFVNEPEPEPEEATPPPRFSWAMAQVHKIMGSQFPLERSKSYSGEQLEFRMSMSNSDDSKENNAQAANQASYQASDIATLPKLPWVRDSRAFSRRSSPINIPHDSVSHQAIFTPSIAMGLDMLHRCVDKMKKFAGSSPVTKDEACGPEEGEAASSKGYDSTGRTEAIAEASPKDNIRTFTPDEIDPINRIIAESLKSDLQMVEPKGEEFLPVDADAPNKPIDGTRKMGLDMLHSCVGRMKQFSGSVPVMKSEMFRPEQSEAVLSKSYDSTRRTEAICDYIGTKPRAAVASTMYGVDTINRTIAESGRSDMRRVEPKGALSLPMDADNKSMDRTRNTSESFPKTEAGSVVSTKASAIDVKDLMRKTREAMSRAIALARMIEGAESVDMVEIKKAEQKGAVGPVLEETVVEPKGEMDEATMDSTMTPDDIERAWAEIKSVMRRRSGDNSATSRAETKTSTRRWSRESAAPPVEEESEIAEARRRRTSESAVIQATNEELEKARAEMKAAMRSREEYALSRNMAHALAEARNRLESARIKAEQQGATGGASRDGTVAQADASKPEKAGARPKDTAAKKKAKKVAVMMQN